MSEKGFDASRYVVKLRGKEYLEVKWRLLWLRTQHPDARIETEMVSHDPQRQMAIFKAHVSIPNAGSATGWGQEEASDFADYLEKAECVPLRTEILTREGFKSFNQVQIGDDVLAYDAENDQTVWTPLQQVAVFPRGHVVALENNAGWRVECTSDHSWAIERQTTVKMARAKVRELRQARHLKTSDSIILAAPAPGGEHPITPAEAAILGWLVTDGHIRSSGRGMIAQAKEPHVSTIRELVGAVAREYVMSPGVRTFPTGRTYQTRESYQWHLPTTVVRPLLQKAGIETLDDLPKLVSQLTVEARRTMLETFMAAEGDARGNFAQKPGSVLDAFELLATLEGKALAPRREASFGNVQVQRLKKRRHLCASELAIHEVGSLPVWCPTTAFGTWVMRQDGIVTVTGNTKALGRALAALGFGTQFTEDFEFGAENERVVDAPVDRAAVGAGPSNGANGHNGAQRAERPTLQTVAAGVATGGRPEARPALPATEPQIKAIYAIGRGAQSMDEPEVDARCEELFGVRPSELSRRQASEFIDALKAGARS